MHALSRLQNITDTPDNKDVIPLNFLQHLAPNYIEHTYSHLALFLKRVIRECPSNDFRTSRSANCNCDANLQCYIYVFFLDIIVLCYVCSIVFGSFGSYEH